MPLVRAASRAGVPSLVVLDFWSHYRERFSDAEGLVEPAAVSVVDEEARDGLIDAGLDARSIHVMGGPQFDRLADAAAASTAGSREVLRGRIGAGADEPFILFVSQPIADLVGRKFGYTEEEVLALLLSSVGAAGMRAVVGVKWHPRETPRSLPPAPAGVRVVDLRDHDSLELAMAADLVTGMNSMLLLEAALLGRVALSVQPGLVGDDPLVANARGLTFAVYDAAGLPGALRRGLDPAWRAEWSKRLPPRPPAPAAPGVVRLIESLAEGPHRSHDVEAGN